MITLQEARTIIAETLRPPAVERCALGEAHRRVLAEEVKADAFYPAADRSMMDGYALGADDDSARFRVVGEVQAGGVAGFAVQRGECARIFTGADLPPGTSQVIPQEDVEREGEWMRPRERGTKLFVRRRGIEAQPGDVVLPRGTVLGAAELAILAQLGVTRVPIYPAARVAHLATGDELIAPDAPLSSGKIRDTNSSLTAALVRDAGASLQRQQRFGDDRVRLTTWAREAEEDVLLISGGASVGDYDFGPQALREAGFTMHFDKVKLRPGKPLTFATRGTQAAFVIPGNPVSHFVCFQVGIRLALERLQGAVSRWNFIDIPLAGSEGLRGDPRETYWPARVAGNAGRLEAKPLRWSSSGDTFSLAGTNALLRVTGDVEVGGSVPALLLDLPG